MESKDFYDKLFRIPLFTGMSDDELERVMSHTCFDYQKVREGEVIARQGERCGQLFLLIDGTIEQCAESEGRQYAVTEWINGPTILEQSCVFGVAQRFAHTLRATTSVNLITLEKTELLKLASDSLIFRLNIINLLATALQKHELRLWAHSPASLTDRLARFFLNHVAVPYGHKLFHIKMNDLALLLNDSRLDISRALNAMQSRDLLTLSRGKIVIPHIEALR